MAKPGYIETRVNPDLLASVDSVLASLGMTHSEAITLFFMEIESHQGLPFPAKVPNAVTQQAMWDAQTGNNLTTFDSVEALLADAYLPDDERE